MLAPSTKADFHEGRAKIEKNSIKNELRTVLNYLQGLKGKVLALNRLISNMPMCLVN